jgi:large subunit ribosomal protein L17
MFRNMTMALIRHERIITTVAKAKEVRPFIEKLITLAKKNTLHARRLVLARLGPPSKAAVKPIESVDEAKDADERHVIIKLFQEIAPRYAERQGGYTRLLKRHERRLGDAAPTALLELVEAGSGKRVKKARPVAPAPVVAPIPAPAPAPAPAPEAAAPATPPADEQTPPPAAS